MIIIRVLTVFLCGSMSVGLADQIRVYVSPAGNDSNSGATNSPFATFVAARNAVRLLKKDLTNDIQIVIAPGRYFLDSPFELDQRDSGSATSPINYICAGPPGSAHLIGGRAVTNWTNLSNGIYSAQIGPNLTVTTLFENGIRARLARYPNYEYDETFPMAYAGYLDDVGVMNSSTQLQYLHGDLGPIDLAYGPSIFIWSGGSWEWFTDRTPIASQNEASDILNLSHATRYPVYQNSGAYRYLFSSRYFVQGSLQFLDQTGEFCYDPQSGTLFYKPRFLPLSDQELIIPTTKRVITVGGAAAEPVHDINFNGLTFEISDFTSWYRFGWPKAGDSGEIHKYPSYDRQTEMPENREGLVRLQHVHHIKIENCHIKNAGFSGIYLDSDAQEISISGCWIENCGKSGVSLEGPYPGEGNTLRNNLISNCLIEFVGEMVGNSAGVDIANSAENHISNCEIAYSPRYGIQYYCDVMVPAEDNYTRDNEFRNIYIHHVAQDSGDCGAIYAWEIADQTNTLEEILVDFVYHHPSGHDSPPIGLYFDNKSQNQIIRNVDIRRVESPLPFKNSSKQGPGTLVVDNVRGAGAFDPSLIDYPNIGLTPDFPYLSVAKPSLRVAKDKDTMVISWPAEGENFELVQSDSIIWPINWSRILENPSLSNGIARVELTNETGYFALKRRPR